MNWSDDPVLEVSWYWYFHLYAVLWCTLTFYVHSSRKLHVPLSASSMSSALGDSLWSYMCCITRGHYLMRTCFRSRSPVFLCWCLSFFCDTKREKEEKRKHTRQLEMHDNYWPNFAKYDIIFSVQIIKFQPINRAKTRRQKYFNWELSLLLSCWYQQNKKSLLYHFVMTVHLRRKML